MSKDPQTEGGVGPRRGWRAGFRLWWSRICLVLLVVLLLLIVDRFTLEWIRISTFVLVYCASILIMSLVTFITYWIDKRRARGGISDRRIPESTLHVMSLMGGWPGAIVAQETFRHKTQKTSFRIMLWVTILLHGVGVTWLLWELKQKFAPSASTVARIADEPPGIRLTASASRRET